MEDNKEDRSGEEEGLYPLVLAEDREESTESQGLVGFGGYLSRGYKKDSEHFKEIFDQTYGQSEQYKSKSVEEMADAKKRFVKLELAREKKHYKAYLAGRDNYKHADRHFPVLRGTGDTLTKQLSRRQNGGF